MKDVQFGVSVVCMTYNHSNYISDAMDGFVLQQTSFPYICFIIDDASTDENQRVICDFLARNFDVDNSHLFIEKEYGKIIYARHKENRNCYFYVLFLNENHYSRHKSKRNYLPVFQENIPFQALCEGDDYWTDKNKLQAQYDFLTRNPNYGLCFTKSKFFYQSKHEFGEEFGGEVPLVLDYMAFDNRIPTQTIMFRLNLYMEYLQEVKPENQRWKMGDHPFYMWMACNSQIGLIDKCCAVYRELEESASHHKNERESLRFRINNYECSRYFIERYKPELLDKINTYIEWLNLELSLISDDRKMAIQVMNHLKELSAKPRNLNEKMMVRLYMMPRLYLFLRGLHRVIYKLKKML